MPESLFDKTVTSNNYDEWHEAELVNDYVTHFVIETVDGSTRYKQMFTKEENRFEIRKLDFCDSWTSVTYSFSLGKFGIEYLDGDTIALLRRCVVDIAGCLGNRVRVELDGVPVLIKTFQDYVDLYPTASMRFYEKINNGWEVSMCLSDGHFEQVSFVNNIATIRGGFHVDYVTAQFIAHIARIVDFEPNVIKRCLWVFVKAVIDNPVFDSETKEKLATDKRLTPFYLNKTTISRFLSSTDFDHILKLKKRKAKLDIPKLEDANLADTAKSGDCTLILTQGDFAKHLAMSGLSGLSRVKRDYYGVYPLNDKLLNVREPSPDKNAEFENIMKILGLRQGEFYENVEKLRYGHLMIIADQDHGGTLIKGLLINFLHFFWPSLLKVPKFLRTFITPIVKASDRKTKQVFPFYTMHECEAWKESRNKETKFKIKYYKGLASISIAEVKKYFADIDSNVADFFWEDGADDEAIDLAFRPDRTVDRKGWIFEVGTILDSKEKRIRIRYRDFICLDFRQYLVADLQKSIPSLGDGLTPDQRYILFCAFKEPIIIQELDVAQFSHYVSAFRDYHHGEASLVSTIVRMAQNYVGSNNINLLQPKGQFGTRHTGGNDHASSKYLFTQLSPMTRYLFHMDEKRFLECLKDGGRSFEPAWFIPIIPMVLVNGCEAIETAGWSSFIPNYNPRDIICNLRCLLEGKEMAVRMRPWYKWFEGDIQKSASVDAQYTTEGIYTVKPDENALSITELPVGKWTQQYEDFLEAASPSASNKTPFIERYKANYDDDETVSFEIFMTRDQMEKAKQEGFVKKFNLTTTLSTANMNLFDKDGVLKKYDTPEQILKEFFELRLQLYEDRRTALLRELEKAISILENKKKFSLLVSKGEICVIDRDNGELCAELESKGFKPFPKEAPSIAGAAGEHPGAKYDYLLSIGNVLMTNEEEEELWQKLEEKKREFTFLTETSSKSLWLTDLDALEHQLDKQDKRDAGFDSGSDLDEEEPMKRSKQGKEGRNPGKQEDRDLDVGNHILYYFQSSRDDLNLSRDSRRSSKESTSKTSCSQTTKGEENACVW